MEQLTDDAVAVSFVVPPELYATFTFAPGQHVTVRALIDGQDVRRSYSICTQPEDGHLRIGVKRLLGGVFSTFATSRLAPGDSLEIMPPVGDFTIATDPAAQRHLCAIAAGSGITPVLSMAMSVLESEPLSQFTLLLGNRAARTVMFLEDLEALKDRFPDRFHLIHVFSQEASHLPIFAGRIDATKLQAMFATLINPATVDDWFLCGPFGMVAAARSTLTNLGVSDDHIHDELFFAGSIDEVPLPLPDENGTVELTILLEGRSTITRMNPTSSILDAALSVRHELPFSCKGGMCATCKGRLISGEVTMDKNFALVDSELADGYVLTCQSHPTTDAITVDYDI